MKIGDFVTQDFIKAAPYQGTSIFRKTLIEGTPVVVEEDNNFLGILTLNDLFIRQHVLVIDALTPKPLVDYDEEVFPVLLSMCHNSYEFLAVTRDGEFEGVVSKKKLFIDFLNAEHEQSSPSEDSAIELKKELALKNKFLSIIGHDVKNLFNQVSGSLELLYRRLGHIEDDRIKTVLHLARQSAEQVNSTFEGMLLWARLGTDQFPFKPELIPLKDQFTKILGQFQLAGNVKNITIKNILYNNIDIYADANMLKCILLNLIYNALKFTPPGGEIWLDAKNLNGKTEIVVLDSGTGMSLSQRDRLFSTGQATSGTLNEMGSGIGLIICKEFVEKHGGTIEIESEPGNGTCVILSFPILTTVTSEVPR